MNKVGDTLLHFGPNENLVLALINNEVEFVLIGGLAISWYCPEREADDMDLMVNPKPDNSIRISNALSSLQLSGHNVDSFTKPGLQIPLKSQFYAELLTPRTDGPIWDEIIDGSVEGKLFNLSVRLPSISVLIRLKEHAATSEMVQKGKHLSDIQLLKKYAV